MSAYGLRLRRLFLRLRGALAEALRPATWPHDDDDALVGHIC